MPPASLVGGWYDIFLPGQISDFVLLRDSGHEARLTIGPWTHTSPRGSGESVRDALDWFDVHLRGLPPARRSPVRLYVMGSNRWVDLPSWPPPAELQSWYLHGGGELSPVSPAEGEPDRYRYDPSDPTPGHGGASLDVRRAGVRNQRRRETRSDVLTYTSAPLISDLTIAGPVTTSVWVRSSHPYIDMFARLCDVNTSGKSSNICDGILRLDSEPVLDGGVRRAAISMWPTAITFRRGHRIRLQISSGAHPLFARNTGTGERLATAATLVASNIEVFHDPEHPSAIELPVSSI
jgi:putative CocE/NonD family hydrolase